MTITEFLEARIGEDEEIAQAATTGPWRAVDECDVRDGGDKSLMDYADLLAVDAFHIARHNPVRVLSECAAKRARLQIIKDGWISYNDDNILGDLLAMEAAAYRDHPDYQQEWSLKV